MDRREFIKSLAAGLGMSGLLVEKLIAGDTLGIRDDRGSVAVPGCDLSGYVFKEFTGAEIEPGRLRRVGCLESPPGCRGLRLAAWMTCVMEPFGPGATEGTIVEWSIRRPAPPVGTGNIINHVLVRAADCYHWAAEPGHEVFVAEGGRLDVMVMSHAPETITVGTILAGRTM